MVGRNRGVLPYRRSRGARLAAPRLRPTRVTERASPSARDDIDQQALRVGTARNVSANSSMRLNSRRRPTPIANNDAPSSMDQKSRIHLSPRASRCAYTGPQKFGMYRSHMVAIVERHQKSLTGGGGAPAAQRTKFCTRRSSL